MKTVEGEHALEVLRRQSSLPPSQQSNANPNQQLRVERKLTLKSDLDSDFNASLGKLSDLQRENKTLLNKLKDKESLNLTLQV
jgi:hypothetical protein